MNLKTLNLKTAHSLCMLVCLILFVGFSPAMAQTSSIKVTGSVVDEQQEAMIGVTVMAKGLKTGTITDFDGNFSLSVPSGTKELQIGRAHV